MGVVEGVEGGKRGYSCWTRFVELGVVEVVEGVVLHLSDLEPQE